MSRLATQSRSLHRAIHLIAGAVLGTFVYSPLREVFWFRLATQGIVVPLVTATGIWLWKGPALRSWLRRKAGEAAANKGLVVRP